MHIKEGFKIVNYSGMNTVVQKNGNLQDTIVLNDTASFLWKMLENGNPSKSEMLNGLLDNFDISTVLALNDIDIFLRTMRANNIIEE